MAIGQNFYPDQEYADIENLSRSQSRNALTYGDRAASYADPFMQERGKYQRQLSDLMADPGSFASSPTYKFAYDQGLEALHRKGGIRSGAKLAALQNYGQGMASQQFNTQAKLLSDLAMGGSSPAAAGLAYARGADRSQDYQSIGQAAKGAGAMQNRGAGGGSSQLPWWMTSGSPTPSLTSEQPMTGTYYSTGGGVYQGGGGAQSPLTMSLDQLNAEAAKYGLPPRYANTSYDYWGDNNSNSINDNYDPFVSNYNDDNYG